MNDARIFRNRDSRRRRPVAGRGPISVAVSCWLLMLFFLLLGFAGVTPTQAEEADLDASQSGVAGESASPLSTIVEIQNHGERFFDWTDSATDTLNQIGERDEVWEAAREAKARADANPDDPRAQADYRAARSRFFHQRVGMLRKALEMQSGVAEVFEAFSKQLDIEITAIQRQVAVEHEAARQHENTHREYASHLQRLAAQIEDAEDLDSQAVDLLKDVQRIVLNTEYQKVLAEERELLANESLNDLRQTQIYAQSTFRELQDEFKQARSDLRLLEDIARNEQSIVNRDQRQAILQRYQQRRPINRSQNRQMVADVIDAIRKRQGELKAEQRIPEDMSLAEVKAGVMTFLHSMAPVDATNPEDVPDDPDLPRGEIEDSQEAERSDG